MTQNAGEADIRHRIDELISEEHGLRADPEAMDAERRTRLAAVEAELDQCWDLLRQRAARQEFHQDPERAQTRPVRVVERYES
ncbi:DUF2630 family protein [Actinospica durhamensis]|uniref:DUF2630 family protein n=1 Tax=Actinospica durhamensis TaxID=1508375 RepID=A0A941F0N5_9ACTN|nr:DUF2630 family protein [Actinospica durhamensis]MBR7838264.1 DUF2630 family protein [Actinospica durhamensis]